MRHKVFRTLVHILLVIVFASSLTGCARMNGGQATGRVKVGLSFAEFATERWKNEQKLMQKLLEDKGYEVIYQEANHDVGLQNRQIDWMVSNGVKALIVVPEDGSAVAPAVEKAAQAGVQVIAYDRLIKSPRISAYISFNNVEVGRLQAEGVLRALQIDTWDVAAQGKVRLVKLGGSPADNNAVLLRHGQDQVLAKYADKIDVVADEWVENWDAALAYKIMEGILAKTGNDIDAVIASNDGTALGALQAMRAQKLAGHVPVSGQDASADGCNSIARGELAVTVLKDIRNLSPQVVDLTDKLLKGEKDPNLKPYTLAELTNDPSQPGSVLAYFLPVSQVMRENLFDRVVMSGFQKYDDVYRDIPEAQRPPKPQ